MSRLLLYKVFQLIVAQQEEAVPYLLPPSLQCLTQAQSPHFTSEEAKSLP